MNDDTEFSAVDAIGTVIASDELLLVRGNVPKRLTAGALLAAIVAPPGSEDMVTAAAARAEAATEDAQAARDAAQASATSIQHIGTVLGTPGGPMVYDLQAGTALTTGSYVQVDGHVIDVPALSIQLGDLSSLTYVVVNPAANPPTLAVVHSPAVVPAGSAVIATIYGGVVNAYGAALIYDTRGALRRQDGSAGASSLAKWRLARGKAVGGTARARVLFIGTSLVRGFGAGPNAANPNALGASGAAAAVLAKLTGGDNDSVIGAGNIGDAAAYHAYDLRVTFGGAASVAAFNVISGSGFYIGTGGIWSFAPDHPVDTVDVWYCRNGGFGSAGVSVDGGAALATINANGAGGLVKQTVTFPRGAHTITLTGTGGDFYFVGVEAYDSTTPRVSVLNAGQGGSTSLNWVDQTNPWSAFPAIAALAPDLTLIDIGNNDWWAAGGTGPQVDVGTYGIALGNLIDQAHLSGDAVLILPSPDQRATDALQATYVAQARLVAQNKAVSIVDLYGRYQGRAAGVAPFLFDTVHFTRAGQADRAVAIRALLEA